MTVSIPTLIITGAVGVGKTTVASAISDRLNDLEQPHALIDMDTMRQCYPNPPDDPFHMALGFSNLAAVWTNYRAVGADRLIAVDVVETRAQRAEYERAIPGAAIQIVRLTASLSTLHSRLEGRESGASLEWHQNRAVELTALMDERKVEDWLIDTDGKPISQIVDEILIRIGWQN